MSQEAPTTTPTPMQPTEVEPADVHAPVARLNWGCRHAVPGWVNSDLRPEPGIELVCDILEGIPVADETFDYVASMHALPMISYPSLVPALVELRRLLKTDGVLRLGLPDLDRGIAAYRRGDRSYFHVPDADEASLSGKFIVHMLWYGFSVTLFTEDLIVDLLARAGFRHIRPCAFERTSSRYPGIVDLDNRERESLFVEATK